VEFVISFGRLQVQCLLKNCTARSCFFAAVKEENVPRFLRFPVLSSFLREYKRNSPDLSLRIIHRKRCVPLNAGWRESRYEVFCGRVMNSDRRRADIQTLFRGIVVQVLSKPSFDFGYAHSFAFAVVGDLITADLAQAEITRFWMGKIKTTHARSRPHGK
jgi:hypothetical protein